MTDYAALLGAEPDIARNIFGDPEDYAYYSRAQYQALAAALREVMAERDGLLKEVQRFGDLADICTFDVLHKVCSNCRCKRKDSAMSERGDKC